MRNNFLVLRNIDFADNVAPLVGGSVYVGEDHVSVKFENVSVTGSSAESGGGIFISRFCKEILISSSVIVANSAVRGGGLASAADRLTIRESTVDRNFAELLSGGILIEDALVEVSLIASSVSGNVAGTSAGGIRIADSTNVIVDSCQLLDNNVTFGSGGAITLSASSSVLFRNSTIARNFASGVGGAALIYTSSDVSFVNTLLQENRAGDSGGALHISIAQQIEVNRSEFKLNEAISGFGSAIYVRATDLTLSKDKFAGNRAAGGGTVFWEHASGMMEPGGLQDANFFADSNVASYGPAWATEAHHTSIRDAQSEFHVVDYGDFAPAVGVELQDVYDHVVVSDSSTLTAVSVPASAEASCYNAIGIVAGTTTVTFKNGTIEFTQLEPLCAPNHSLGLSVATSSSSVVQDTSFVYTFRSCRRGEYFGEFICNPCESGTFSFTDPAEHTLSELTQSEVCRPCPSGASYCEKDMIILSQGYWRSDNFSTRILECPWHIESCRGGRNTGDASCGEGYHGPLCAVCDDGYHFVSTSRTCESCNDRSSFFDPFTVVLIVFSFLCFLIVVVAVKKFIRHEEVSTVDGFFALVLRRIHYFNQNTYEKDQSHDFPVTHSLRVRAFKSIVVYITFYQIVSSLPFILDDVDFPNVFDEILSAVSVVNLFISQETIVTCSSSSEYDYVTKLVVGTTVPIVVAMMLGICCFIHLHCVHMTQEGQAGNEKLTLIASKYKKAALILSFLVLPAGARVEFFLSLQLNYLTVYCAYCLTYVSM